MRSADLAAAASAAAQRPEDWLLSDEERGNPAAGLRPWTHGNHVRPIIHGRPYFAELLQAIEKLGAGDRLFFTDWRGDPDERLDGPGTEISRVLGAAAARGVDVRGLIWRSHLDKLHFSGAENRHLGHEIEAAGGRCLLDMRVRPGGSHHQKLVVLRYRNRPDLDIAYVGGIDLCHSRADGARHEGDPQAVPMASAYGSRPPWHDVQVALRGPVVAEVEEVFRQRWADSSPPARNPLSRLHDLVTGDGTQPGPPPAPLPPPQPCGPHTVQLLRTYPARRPAYPFAPQGERSVARGYQKALRRARDLIYTEDQYLWSRAVAASFAQALAERPELRLIVIVPAVPDMPGLAGLSQDVGRAQAIAELRRSGGDRVAVYSLENHAGTPVYVHAKVCVIDDVWTTVGSDNFNLRSWTHDSELSCAILDKTGAYARDLRLQLCREHLDRAEGDDADLVDGRSTFDAFARSAAALDAWHAGGRRGPRPPGRLRTYHLPPIPRLRRPLAELLYRWISDPDGRPRQLRHRNEF